MVTHPRMNLCIIEDNLDLLANLRLLLGGEPGISVGGAFGSAEAALAADPWERCDVLLVDIDLPGLSGVDLIRQLHPQHPHLQILVHTICENRATVFAALKAGAMGYLLKGSSPRYLIESLHTLHLGGAPMSPRIARKVILELQGQTEIHDQAGLTQRELEVLNGIAQGKSYQELADALGRSHHTIHGHIKRVYEKLQAANRGEALQKARSLGVI
jgi:two-component system NarL family response regulator